MRLNKVGLGMYVLMTAWLVLASMARLLTEIEAGAVDVLPFVGLMLGLLALAGMGFGRFIDHGD